MIDTLLDGLGSPGHGDGPLGGVGEHLGGDLNACPGHLSDLLDLRPTFPDQGPALGGRHDEPQGDRGTRDSPRPDAGSVRHVLHNQSTRM